MKHLSGKSLLFVLLLLVGCVSPTRTLFKIDNGEQINEKYNYSFKSEGINARIQGNFGHQKRTNLRFYLENTDDERFLVRFDRDKISHSSCDNKRIGLSRIFVTDKGYDPNSFILEKNAEQLVTLEFNRPDCIPYEVSKNMLSFSINFEGINILDSDDEKIDFPKSIKVSTKPK
ncbi:MAG: hypothetical protein R6V36_00560 [Psychroflexus sp.]